MSDIYFVVTDAELTIDGRKTNVVKCEHAGVQDIILMARAQSIDRIWVAKAISVEERNIQYKASKL